MKTILYEDITTNDLKTFKEIKEEYIKQTGSDFPILYDILYKVIDENLVQNGGNIREVDDELLLWCNDYCDYVNKGCSLSYSDRDIDVKNIYECISCKGDYLYEGIMIMLENDESETAKELLARLNKLV